MSNEMIDRVARALIDHHTRVYTNYKAFYFDGEAKEMARLVIEAMCDPTPLMLDAGWKAITATKEGETLEWADHYRAMIQAALPPCARS